MKPSLFVHNNGFVILESVDDPNVRFHFYGHDDTPKEEPVSDIHDHRFSFLSEILVGSITNHRYMQVNGNRYAVLRASNANIKSARGGRCDLIEVGSERVWRGGDAISSSYPYVYRMDAKAIHRVEPHNVAVTRVSKTYVDARYDPRIFIKAEDMPMNTSFDRYTHRVLAAHIVAQINWFPNLPYREEIFAALAAA